MMSAQSGYGLFWSPVYFIDSKVAVKIQQNIMIIIIKFRITIIIMSTKPAHTRRMARLTC